MGVDFRILGPVEVRRDGRLTEVAGKPLDLLACLLVRANTPVSVDELTDALWSDGREPADPKRTIQTYVLRIRRALGSDVVTTTRTGYRADATADTLDLLRFHDLSARGADAVAAGDYDVAAARYVEALTLWRGPALHGIASDVLRRQDVPALAEERLDVFDRWADVQLRLGSPPVAELQQLTQENPLRERFWELLILALYRSGRQADALAAYREVTRLLDDELGVLPGPQLQRVHEAVLRGDPALEPEPPARPGVPRQLSAAVDSFTGRGSELKALAAAASRTNSAAAVIVTIEGTGGVGKTTLAQRFCQDVLDDYPDGQLQLNLRGYGPGDPIDPDGALEYLLQSVGVPGEDLPTSVESRAALWRTHTAGRRLLVLLDNARNSAQVRALAPGPGCLLIVTSRAQLSGLAARDGAVRIRLPRLSDADALDLLATTVGPDRVAADPVASRLFIDRCARLPLAIRILGEQANQHAGRPLLQFLDDVDDLDDDARLGAFDLDDGDDTSLRAIFSRSYVALDAEGARAFRTLGLHPARTFSAADAAALIGLSVAATRARLDRLVGANLLEMPSVDRYEFHDLLRVFAVEQAHTLDSDGTRLAAQERVIAWYLHAARRASEIIRPGWIEPDEPADLELPSLVGRGEAMTWCTAEHGNLLLTVARAHELELHSLVCQLVLALRPYFSIVPRYDGWMSTHQLALRSARVLGDRRSEGRLLNGLGLAHIRFGNTDTAIEHCDAALTLARELDLVSDEFAALNNLSIAALRIGDQDRSIRLAEEARVAADRSGDTRLRIMSRNNLGAYYLEADRPAEAVPLVAEALDLIDNGRYVHERAHALLNLAEAQAAQQQHVISLATFATALDVAREAGAQLIEAEILEKSGDVHAALDDVGRARELYRGAVRVLESLGHPDAGRVSARLGAAR